MNGTQHLSEGAQLLREYPTGGWLRVAFKAPLYLWRMGLGFLIGRYIMVITTFGRKSGLPRSTGAEWHPLRGSKFVPVNYGERAQWYKNIQANPHVTIQTAHGTERVTARRITDDAELIEAYHVIQARNPMMTQWFLESKGIQDSEADILAHKDRIFLVTFDPTDEPTPPPLQADLVWVWAALIGGWLLFGRRR
jgi:deazaflavin-dependent oxidoreductase (nitroreductase family)